MKKALAILFSFFYLLSVSGLSLNFHYCGGKIKKVSFFHTDEEGCCKGEMKETAGCCKEKTATVKTLETHEAPASIQVLSFKNVTAEVQFVCVPSISALYFISQEIPLNHAPPDIVAPPPYLQNRVLLI